MKILIVEDDLALSDVLAFTLRRAGFEIITAYDGLAALTSWEQYQPDLVVLDLNLPKVDGLEVCRRIRAVDKTPIIMLSVRSGDEVVVRGPGTGRRRLHRQTLQPQPTGPRIRAVLRRVGIVETPGVLEVANLTLDRSRNEVHAHGNRRCG